MNGRLSNAAPPSATQRHPAPARRAHGRGVGGLLLAVAAVGLTWPVLAQVAFERPTPSASLAQLAQLAQTAPSTTPAPSTVPSPPVGAQAIHAVRLHPDERLPLDGTLAHPAWQRAPVYDQFVEKFPATGGTPTQATRVRVLFDHQALYVGIEALDTDPSLIRAPLVRHDGVNRTQDFVMVFIDAIGNRQSAQIFRVNASGSLADGMHTAADDHEDFSPDFDFDAAAARNNTGYTAVLRIPFASLRFTTHASADGSVAVQPWRILVARRLPREQAYLHTSVLVPRDAPSFIATMQPLHGVTLPEAHQFLTLRPSVTARVDRQSRAEAVTTRSSALTASLDLKWRPLHELVVDATLNPDFSQVALDVPQLAGNTRFALQFPETRPFFFEASDLLRSPSDAIYSRSFTEPRAGLRGTWRGARLAGSAIALDDRGGGLVLLPGAFGTDTAEQPASQSLVARLRGDGPAPISGPALQWGLVAAQRRYADDRGHNTVLGPDLGWQIADAWRLRAQWLGSDTTALAVGDQLQRRPAVRGQRVLAKLFYQTDAVEGELSIDEVGSGFRDDVGFVAQSGVHKRRARGARGWHGLGPFNDFWIEAIADRADDRRSGELVSQDIRPGVWLTGSNNLEAWLYLHGLAPQWAALRTAAGAPLLEQRYLRGGLTMTPAIWAPLLSAELQWGQLADVTAQRVRPGGLASLSLTTRLLPRLELEPRLSYGWLRQDGQSVYTEAAHQLLARWHFSARQTLRAIVQVSALDRQAEAAQGSSPAVTAQRSRNTTGSLTWAWRQSAGTVLYVGASSLRDGPDTTGAVSRGAEAFLKLQIDMGELRQRF